MNKKQVIVEFQDMMLGLGFVELPEDEYSIKYQNSQLFVQLFFGRYSEKPDIFIRFEDNNKPEQYSTSSMLFVNELDKGMNSLKGIDGIDRLKKVLTYFENNYKQLLDKSSCRESKIKLDIYISTNFS